MSNPEKSYKGCGVVILALFALSVATNVWLIRRAATYLSPGIDDIDKNTRLWTQ